MARCHAKACLSSFRNPKSSGWSNGFVPVPRLNRSCFEHESFSVHRKAGRISKSLES